MKAPCRTGSSEPINTKWLNNSASSMIARASEHFSASLLSLNPWSLRFVHHGVKPPYPRASLNSYTDSSSCCLPLPDFPKFSKTGEGTLLSRTTFSNDRGSPDNHCLASHLHSHFADDWQMPLLAPMFCLWEMKISSREWSQLFVHPGLTFHHQNPRLKHCDSYPFGSLPEPPFPWWLTRTEIASCDLPVIFRKSLRTWNHSNTIARAYPKKMI